MTKNIQEPLTVAFGRRGEFIKNNVAEVAEMAENRDDKIVYATYATYAIYASANFYTGMACLAMDDVRRNAALKYREQDEEEKPPRDDAWRLGRDIIPDN